MDTNRQREVLEDFLKKAQIDVPVAARMSHLGRRFSAYFPKIAHAANPDKRPWRSAELLALVERVQAADPEEVRKANVRKVTAKKAKDLSKTAVFLRSPEWRRLRSDIFRREGYACRACGAKAGMKTVAGDDVRLEVDHIRPMSKHWHARLDPQNLQILCRECNKGKGARFQDDLRKSA